MPRLAKITEELRRTHQRGNARHHRIDDNLAELAARVDALEAALAEHAGDKKAHK